LAGLPKQEFENKVTCATKTAVAASDAPPSDKRSGKGKGKPPRKKAEGAASDDDQTKQPARGEVAKLVRTWVQASAGAKREFVRERWDEIAVARKQLEANGADPYASFMARALPSAAIASASEQPASMVFARSARILLRRLSRSMVIETFELEVEGLRYICTLGRFPDGRVGELFLKQGEFGTQVPRRIASRRSSLLGAASIR